MSLMRHFTGHSNKDKIHDYLVAIAKARNRDRRGLVLYPMLVDTWIFFAFWRYKKSF